MRTFRRLLRLVNLLYHRPSVSMGTIRKVCGVTERTAYRYINVISEAGIPVYYDRDVRGYRLSTRERLSVGGLTISDGLILGVALHLLSTRLNEGYSEDVKRLIQDVIVRQQYPLEQALQAFEQLMASAPAEGDLSAFMSSVLIHAAVSMGRKVRITSHSDDTETTVEIGRPKLVFRDAWRLDAVDDGPMDGPAIDNIRKVSIL